MSNWQLWVIMMVGVVMALSGVVLFVGIADYDYKYSIQTVSGDPPHEDSDITPYSEMSEQQKDVFERAKKGETVRFEEGYPIPEIFERAKAGEPLPLKEENPMPEVVEQNGAYYLAEAPRYIDWTDLRTFGPILFVLLGGVVAIHAIRLDFKASNTP